MIDYKRDNRITVTKGDTLAWKIKIKKISEDLRSAYFTIKENADDEAIIQKTLEAGISKIEDRAYKNEKTYKLQLQAEDTLPLSADMQYLYDLKVAVGNVVKTIASGFFIVKESITSPTQIIIEDAEIEATDLIEAEMETTPATAGIEYEQDPVANAKIGDMDDLETTAKQTLVDAINDVNLQANNAREDIDKILDGTLTVPEATHADTADEATHATSATTADSATTASQATNASTASKVANALTFGSKTFDGSSAKTLIIGDLIKDADFQSVSAFDAGKIGVIRYTAVIGGSSYSFNLGIATRATASTTSLLPTVYDRIHRINSSGQLQYSTDGGSSWATLGSFNVLYIA